jgi:hypothetical protein
LKARLKTPDVSIEENEDTVGLVYPSTEHQFVFLSASQRWRDALTQISRKAVISIDHHGSARN